MIISLAPDFQWTILGQGYIGFKGPRGDIGEHGEKVCSDLFTVSVGFRPQAQWLISTTEWRLMFMDFVFV